MQDLTPMTDDMWSKDRHNSGSSGNRHRNATYFAYELFDPDIRSAQRASPIWSSGNRVNSQPRRAVKCLTLLGVVWFATHLTRLGPQRVPTVKARQICRECRSLHAERHERPCSLRCMTNSHCRNLAGPRFCCGRFRALSSCRWPFLLPMHSCGHPRTGCCVLRVCMATDPCPAVSRSLSVSGWESCRRLTCSSSAPHRSLGIFSALLFGLCRSSIQQPRGDAMVNARPPLFICHRSNLFSWCSRMVFRLRANCIPIALAR